MIGRCTCGRRKSAHAITCPRAVETDAAVLGLPTDAAARKALPVFTYVTEYFPDALLAEVEVAVAGNEQHNPGEPLYWARHKSTDQMDCALRHMLDHKKNPRDTDGQYHLAKAIWRLKAELQLQIESDNAAVTRQSAAEQP